MDYKDIPGNQYVFLVPPGGIFVFGKERSMRLVKTMSMKRTLKRQESKWFGTKKTIGALGPI